MSTIVVVNCCAPLYIKYSFVIWDCFHILHRASFLQFKYSLKKLCPSRFLDEFWRMFQTLRKIRLIECNAKCRYLKNFWPVKGLCGIYLSAWGQEPHPSPLTHCILVYGILVHTGKGGGGGELTREKVRGTMLHKAGRKYQHNWLHLQSINSIKQQ